MANEQHLRILEAGIDSWNAWRETHRIVLYDRSWMEENVDLSGATLDGVELAGANLRGATLLGASLCNANLDEANLQGANLLKADLRRAYLRGANLRGADLYLTNLSGANLSGASLGGADMTGATCVGADFSGASLVNASLLETNLEDANLSNCRVYGISGWNLKLNKAIQSNLVISKADEPLITVDSIEVAQFIYLILNNRKIRDVIDTVTTKVVLILGRFTPERKAILDGIRNELRRCNYLPVLFDFDPPTNRNLTETVSTLAHLARFIIADITEPRSIPQELYAIIPHLPSVPIQPCISIGEDEYAMFMDFRRFPWVLPILRYTGLDDLLSSLRGKLLALADAGA